MLQWPEQWTKKTAVSNPHILYSSRDFIISMLLFLGAVIFCLVLRHFDPDNDTSYVAMIFLLQVFLTALMTDGYLFSIAMAVVGVLSVDYIFTPPYWEVSFTLAGFPLTFLVMMVISITTATVTSKAKERDAMMRAAEKERMYANLLRAISHDIRTPLTGIVGATNVLLEQRGGLTPQQQQELLRNTNEDALWLIRTVENLLSITRIDTEDACVNKQPEVAEEIISAAVGKFMRRQKENNVKVKVNFPEEVLVIPVDALLIEQVLTNLLENAMLHGKTTSEIIITLFGKDGMACIHVEDNGQGIPSETLRHLFDAAAHRAQRGDTKRNMGIGLSVCQTVVQAHNGKISGSNRPDGGAIFTIELPMDDESQTKGC